MPNSTPILSLFLLLATLPLACTDSRPLTAPDQPEVTAPEPPPITPQLFGSVTLSGPDSVTSTQTYTYSAVVFGLVSAHWHFFKRTCPTLTVPSCSVTWTGVGHGRQINAANSLYEPTLSPDCSGGGTKSFQVKVEVFSIYHPMEEDTYATKLCADIPN